MATVVVARPNSTDAKAIVSRLIKRGCSIAEAMDEVGRSPETYMWWRRTDSDFKAKIDAHRGARKNAVKATRETLPVPDFPTFCEKYLGQRLFTHQLQWMDLLDGRPPRDLHDSCTFIEGLRNRLLVNTPTGHGKSTTLTVNRVVWEVVRNPNIKIKVVSKSQRMAEDFLLQIKSRLTDPVYGQMHTDFGPPDGFGANAASWKANRIYVNSDIRDVEQKDPTVEALGMRGQIYGARADLIILDDVVDNINVAEWRKQIGWIQGMLMNRLGRNGVLMVIGTRIGAQDLYSELLRSEHYGGRKPPWTYLAQKAVLEFADDPADWVTLWPYSDSPEDATIEQTEDGLYLKWDGPLLASRRDEVGPVEFARMYQQEAVAADTAFKPAVLTRCQQMRQCGLLPDDPLEKCGRVGGMNGLRIIAGLDPAAVGHTAAVVVGVDIREGKRHILDAFNKAHVHPDEMRQLIIGWTAKYGIDEWVIEANAFQAFLTQDTDLLTELGNRGCVLTPHTTGRNKHDPDFGVLAMSQLFETRKFTLPTISSSQAIRALVDQLCVWVPHPPQGQKTDLVMALWFTEIRAGQLVLRHNQKHVYRDGDYYTRDDVSSRGFVNMNQMEADQARGDTSNRWWAA